MPRDIVLLLIGAGIALATSIVTSLAGEFLRYKIERKRKLDDLRIEAERTNVSLLSRIALLGGGGDKVTDNFLAEYEKLATKRSDQLTEKEAIKLKSIGDILSQKENMKQIAKIIQERKVSNAQSNKD